MNTASLPVGTTPALILASASPRRHQLLLQIGVPHRILPARIVEQQLPGERSEACVERLAVQKARWVWEQSDKTLPVLGADTAVLIDERMLGKPRHRDEALAMLAQLSGRTHQVLSGIALIAAAGTVQARLSVSQVRFREVAEAEAAAYWDSGEMQDKAGGYAIQGRGAIFVAELRGSYSGVMGLPLLETAQLLRAAGVGSWWGEGV
jgi:septum formation protein